MKYMNNGLYLDYALAEKNGVSRKELDDFITDRLNDIEPIEEVFTAIQLADNRTDNPFLTRFQNSYFSERVADIFFRVKPYYLRSSGHGTSHGSPYHYDSHVPLIFMGPGIRAGHFDDKVRTVDLAPTLADLLQITPVDKIDGKSLAPQITVK